MWTWGTTSYITIGLDRYGQVHRELCFVMRLSLPSFLDCGGPFVWKPLAVSTNADYVYEQMFDEAWVEVSGGNLVRLPELSARLAVGEKGPVSASIGIVRD